MANFDEYFALYDKGSFSKAYTVLSNIMKSEPRWSEVGDMYVWCADLELLVNNDLYRARQLLDKALALGCRFMASYYSTSGYVFWRTGERDRGIQELEKSVELNSSITNLKTLGKILASDHDRCAISVCQRILKKDPKNCSAHIYLGIEAAKAGERDRALLMVRCAEKLDPTVRNFNEIGWLYHELEKYNEALSAYLEADSRGYEPKGSLYAAIAACYYMLDDYVKATEYSSRALDLDFNYDYPKDVLLSATEKEGAGLIIDNIIEKHNDTCLAFILYAQEALKQKVFSKASRFLSKAKQLEPSPVEMYQIGRLYANLEYFEKALKVYLECEKMGYDKKDLLYASIAGCYLYLDNAEAAIQYASKALDFNFNNDYAKDILLCFVEREEMGTTLERLVEEYSNTCLALIILAQEAFRENNLSETRELLVKAEQLDPSPAEMYNISLLYYDLKNFEKALKACLRSEILGYSDKRRLYILVADCYYCVDDYDMAIQYAIRALAIDPDYEYTKDILYACRRATWGTEFGDNY